MRVEPRQNLLELWRAVVRYSYRDGAWQTSSLDEANSTADAEQLLCFMYPAYESEYFKLSAPDRAPKDVLRALDGFGDPVNIPKVLIRATTTFMERYRAADGTPVFPGGGYLRGLKPGVEPIPEQRDLDVVDSMSMSVTLALSTLGFVRSFRRIATRRQSREEADRLEKLASDRLTAAMVGLLRSFAINTFSPTSPEGRALLETVNPERLPEEQVLTGLRRALARARVNLREATIGTVGAEDVENESDLFECGWTWGILKDAPRVDSPAVREQQSGVAWRKPSLYFTVVALDGIADLFSARTMINALLNREQQELANLLRFRWALTLDYWSTIAGFGSGKRWPIEDIPWRSGNPRSQDGYETEYYSLLATAVMIESLAIDSPQEAGRAVGREPALEMKVERLAGVLRELAARGLVTRRPRFNDPAIELHVPGVSLELGGAEEIGPEIAWPVYDFSTALFKRTIRLASMTDSVELRDRVLQQADAIWEHLAARRRQGGKADGLWDAPDTVFKQVSRLDDDQPSWYLTERVVEAMVAASSMIKENPPSSSPLATSARHCLAEADHLLSQELLAGTLSLGPISGTKLVSLRTQVERARGMIEANRQPGTALAILQEVLRDLDSLAVARDDVRENG